MKTEVKVKKKLIDHSPCLECDKPCNHWSGKCKECRKQSGISNRGANRETA